MGKITISVIKADVGGYVGHCDIHPDMRAEAKGRVADAVREGLLLDAHVDACGDDVNLVMTHEHGVDAEAVHGFAWETFLALTDVARRLHLYGAGQDLLTDSLTGRARSHSRRRTTSAGWARSSPAASA